MVSDPDPDPTAENQDQVLLLPDAAVLTAHCCVLSGRLHVHVVQSRLPDDVVSPSEL